MSIFCLLVAALVSVFLGFIWYNPNVFGTIWMKESNIEGKAKPSSGQMFKLIALHFVGAFFLSFVLQMLVIHQFGVTSSVGGDPSKLAPTSSYFAFMAEYGTAFRTFKHGALHGFMTGLFFLFPVIMLNGLYESKSWKYIFITVGYWTISLTIMGGIICAW